MNISQIEYITEVKYSASEISKKGDVTMYEKFAELLAKNNMTVYEVSKETGIPESTLAMWKSRGSVLSALNLRKIARLFGVTIEDLLPEE